MCCNSYKILVLFTFVFISYLLNGVIPSIPVILWYLFCINIFTFLLFIIDKFHALKNRKRVPEVSLYFLSLGGGIFGALLSMLLTKHKLKKSGFLYIQVAIFVAWVTAIFLVLSNLQSIQEALGQLFK